MVRVIKAAVMSNVSITNQIQSKKIDTKNFKASLMLI